MFQEYKRMTVGLPFIEDKFLTKIIGHVRSEILGLGLWLDAHKDEGVFL